MHATSVVTRLVMIAGLGLAFGCSGDATAGAGHARCPTPVAAENASALPRSLGLESLGTVTKVVRQRGFVNATAITEGTLQDLHTRFSRELRAAGFAIVGAENEIIEADVFFARGQHTTGGVKLIKTACGDRVRVQLFVGSTPANSG